MLLYCFWCAYCNGSLHPSKDCVYCVGHAHIYPVRLGGVWVCWYWQAPKCIWWCDNTKGATNCENNSLVIFPSQSKFFENFGLISFKVIMNRSPQFSHAPMACNFFVMGRNLVTKKWNFYHIRTASEKPFVKRALLRQSNLGKISIFREYTGFWLSIDYKVIKFVWCFVCFHFSLVIGYRSISHEK